MSAGRADGHKSGLVFERLHVDYGRVASKGIANGGIRSA